MGLHSNYAADQREMGDLMYPSEAVVRIFKGSYPELKLPKDEYEGSSILDVGCGDGRHLVFFASDLGFDTFGVEPTEDLAGIPRTNVDELGIDATVTLGSNRDLPYEDDRFDYLLAWNSCYYMGEDHDFDFGTHVEEYARVLKPGGRVILSIPKGSSFIYENSRQVRDGYREVRDDPFGVRDGTILRRFGGLDEVIDAFGPQFADFAAASIHDDFFGYDYHWWLLVGTRAVSE